MSTAPLWTSGLVGVDSDLAYTKLEVFGSVVTVRVPDGTTLGFAKKAVTASGTTFDSETDADVLTLTYATDNDSYTLAQQAGGTVTFTRQSGDPVGEYVPTSATTAGLAKTVTYSWESTGLLSGILPGYTTRGTRIR